MRRVIHPRLAALAAALLILPVLAAGCGDGDTAPQERALSCPPETELWTEYELYFGLSQADGGTVSEQDWSEFLAAAVTPRFPDGLTVLDARGQWRRADGVIQREASKVLVIFAPGRAALGPIDEISAEYAQRFEQTSVLRVIDEACVSFRGG